MCEKAKKTQCEQDLKKKRSCLDEQDDEEEEEEDEEEEEEEEEDEEEYKFTRKSHKKKKHQNSRLVRIYNHELQEMQMVSIEEILDKIEFDDRGHPRRLQPTAFGQCRVAKSICCSEHIYINIAYAWMLSLEFKRANAQH